MQKRHGRIKASYDMLIDSSRISEKELAAMLRAL